VTAPRHPPSPLGEADRQAVMAYVDGELEGDAAAAFEARLAVEPMLAGAVAAERALRATLAAAYDPVLDEPLPEALQRLVAAPQAPAEVVSLASARAARAGPPSAPSAANDPAARPWRWPEWAAMAACLVLGVAIGIAGLWRGGGDVPDGAAATLARAADGRLLAQGTLAERLDVALASEPAADGIAIGLSFRATGGGWCRSFAMAGAAPAGGALAGIACQAAPSSKAWTVHALAPAPGADAGGGYRTAATALPPTLLTVVDDLRAGDTLDAAAERAARDAGWR
jgi:anti-sigma factor RsiW